MLKHNKKRNVGLLSEFFARKLAKSIVENNDVEIKKAKTLLKKYFSEGSELLEELRLFRVLQTQKLGTRENLNTLLEKIQEAAKKQDSDKLNLEKTAFIHEINHAFGAGFFEEKIDNYKTLASIQTLLNFWRTKEEPTAQVLSESLHLKEELANSLLGQPVKKPVQNPLEKPLQENIDRLVFNILEKKITEKFSGSLSSEQRKLLNLWVFGEQEALQESLKKIEKETMEQIQKAERSENLDSVTVEKFSVLKEGFEKIKEAKGTEKEVTFFMGLIQLNKELSEK